MPQNCVPFYFQRSSMTVQIIIISCHTSLSCSWKLAKTDAVTHILTRLLRGNHRIRWYTTWAQMYCHMMEHNCHTSQTTHLAVGFFHQHSSLLSYLIWKRKKYMNNCTCITRYECYISNMTLHKKIKTKTNVLQWSYLFSPSSSNIYILPPKWQ